MRDLLQILAFVIIAIVLLWFGFGLIMGQWERMRVQKMRHKTWSRRPDQGADTLESCPICSSKLRRGDLVKTLAFPSITGGKDRLMHIRGCIYCIDGGLKRKCPVCHAALDTTDVLVARIFERPDTRAHVHITGCNKCRRTGKI